MAATSLWLLPACEGEKPPEPVGQTEPARADVHAALKTVSSLPPVGDGINPANRAESVLAADVVRMVVSVQSGAGRLDEGGMNTLLDWLRGLDPKAAVQGMLHFLDSRQDRSTGREFVSGAQGIVHSGLRALLLDELGRMDPEAAARVSRKILDHERGVAADVHAVALRNAAAVAGDPLSVQERDYFRPLWEEVAARPQVLDGSCNASLAALEMAAFLGDSTTLDRLAVLRESASSSSARSAIEGVMEAVLLRAPTASVLHLAGPANQTFGEAPTLRGAYLAHADLNHSLERQAIATFLADPATSPEARASFVQMFPNEAETLRPSLFDPGQSPLLDEISKDYSAALQVVRQWQKDPAMAGAEDALSVMELRLEGILENQGSKQE
jgi:hypothetical protein